MVLRFTFSKQLISKHRGVSVMVFNATFNNMSVISLWSVLLVEETRESRDNATTDLS